MREQEKWTEHAAFINSLLDRGVVVLGGPLGNGPEHRALLILNDTDEPAVRTRFSDDPWIRAGILRILTIEPWKLLASNDKLDPVLAEITQAKPST